MEIKIPRLSTIVRHITDRNIATAILVILNIQIVFIEGYTISPVKVGMMALMPFIFLLRVPYMSKAVVLGMLYLINIILSALFHAATFRLSTIGYLGMFVITFFTFYNYVYKGVFSLEYFIRFVKAMILAYSICLICQQVLILAGIRFMPLVNLNNQFFLSINKLPSLSLEPSHTARILGILYYAYLKCNEYKQGSPVNIKQIFGKEHLWVTLAFLWSMLTMGSGTAFICLGILSLYFMKGAYLLLSIPVFIGVYYTLSFFEVQQFQRASSVVEATLTGNSQNIIETDGSAASRITPMLNTIQAIDLNDFDTWFGHGVDYNLQEKKKGGKELIGEINDYGLIAYILGLILVFSCAIEFRSLATIMYFLGVGGGTGNIAYAWGSLMIFACIRYFHHHAPSDRTMTDETAQTQGDDI